jgi:hypothetical protein
VQYFKDIKTKNMTTLKIPRNIEENTKTALIVLNKEGHIVEANLCNGYYGYALHVDLDKVTKFKCRFPKVKFIGCL